MRRRVARLQTWWVRAFVVLVLAGVLTEVPPAVLLPAVGAVLGLSLVRAPRTDRAVVDLRAPVRGRWEALNSPGTKVPSHGVRAYGQEYAVDVRHPPPAGAPSGPGRRLATRRPEDFSCFGEGVHAVADGVVVRASDARRDQRSRDTWPALLLMLGVEGFVRELAGVGWVLGNHVVLDHGDGTYSAYAHLRRGSLRVRPGERVVAGRQLAEVGNTGNTSEPHLHFQLMDHPCPTAAAGVPWRWVDVSPPEEPGPEPGPEESGAPRGPSRRSTALSDVPADGQVFSVP